MDYSNVKNTSMKFNIKNTIGITAFLISQGMAAQFYVGVQSGIGNIQSDIKVTSARYIELGRSNKSGLYLFFNQSYWNWNRSRIFSIQTRCFFK